MSLNIKVLLSDKIFMKRKVIHYVRISYFKLFNVLLYVTFIQKEGSPSVT